jgi:hypothetical protein
MSIDWPVLALVYRTYQHPSSCIWNYPYKLTIQLIRTEGLLIGLIIFIKICLSSFYNRASTFVPIKLVFDILWSTWTRMKFGRRACPGSSRSSSRPAAVIPMAISLSRFSRDFRPKYTVGISIQLFSIGIFIRLFFIGIFNQSFRGTTHFSACTAEVATEAILQPLLLQNVKLEIPMEPNWFVWLEDFAYRRLMNI